jgi:hypothetical protein
MRTEFVTNWFLWRRRVIGLLIFTAAMLAGCIFLLYFLVAIWRDAHKQRRGPRVEIIKLPSRRGFTNNKSTNLRMVAAFLVLTTVFAAPALAQETIFNVPSGDILDKGKVYGEFDFVYFWDASAGSLHATFSRWNRAPSRSWHQCKRHYLSRSVSDYSHPDY